MRIARWFVVMVLAGCLGQAQAHWPEQSELPEWAHRGKLYWSLHYSTHTRALVDLFVDGGQTLVHGGAFDSPETAEYARQKGLRYMPYVCSRTMTLSEIAKYPQLKDAVLLRDDGSEYLAYNNPVRRYGSLFAPAWPEHIREYTQRAINKPDAVAVFYDNFTVREDHHPLAVAAWKKWATEHGIDPGNDVPPLRDNSPRSAAGRLFQAEAIVAYYAGLRAFNRQHNPPSLISPNLGSSPYGAATMEAGAVDLVFYETMSHPPFENNAYRYKLGLGASHGRPTGILAYLPPKISSKRGVRTWSEGMHNFFFLSSPVAEEFSLAAAEAAACGGTYIPCYSLFPSLPITDLTDPFNQRIHRAIKQSYVFLHAHEPLYASAQPGSNVGILHSTSTQIQDTRAQKNDAIATALTAAGIPFEVLVASDLTGDGMRGIETLVVQNAIYLDASTADALVRFVQGGGRAVLAGEFARFDPMGRPVSYASAQKLADLFRMVDLPLAKWNLDGFEPEDTHFRVKAKKGIATLAFNGSAGRYVARIRMTDENDGTSPFSLAVNDKAVFEGKLDLEDEQTHWFQSPPFDLAPGDRLTLTVHADRGERGRTYAVLLANADAEAGLSLGRGQVVYSSAAIESLPADRLLQLLRPKVHVENPGKVFVNVMKSLANSVETVHLVNYDFRYQTTVKGLYASDNGEPKARTVLTRPKTVVRKRLTIDNPAAVVDPVLQIYAPPTPKCSAELVVTLNGKPAGRIRNEGANNRGWIEMPLDRALLARDNTIEIQAEGPPDKDQYWSLSIDTTCPGGNSFYSTDAGKTFTLADLSADLSVQTGEYLIRIYDRRPDALGEDPKNLARNAGFETMVTLHDETKLTVAPAEKVEVVVEGKSRPCLALSPEAPPMWLSGVERGSVTAYTLPRVHIYTMLALAGERSRLEPLFQSQTAAAPWTIPPVTTPLRQTLAQWKPYGKGFAMDAANPHSGKQSVCCQSNSSREMSGLTQQFDLQQEQPQPIAISVWSRAEDVSGKADSRYSIFVDATCDDGSVMKGLNASFPTGTQPWNQATLKISPPQPIRVLNLYLVFRGHTGRVWFDDVSVKTEP
jgi:hypothetical protein